MVKYVFAGGHDQHFRVPMLEGQPFIAFQGQQKNEVFVPVTVPVVFLTSNPSGRVFTEIKTCKASQFQQVNAKTPKYLAESTQPGLG